MNLEIFLHHNDSFALFSNFAYKDRYAYEFYFIVASYIARYFRRSGIKLSNKYS